MRILFFGSLGDRIGREIQVDPTQEFRTVADLRRLLAASFPEVKEALLGGSVRACVDDAIVPDDHAVGEAEAVEFFPPLSGG